MTIKGYRCPNCGKMLTLTDNRNNILTCEACNSQYKMENDHNIVPYYVHHIPYNTHEIVVSSQIPWEFVKENPEFAMKCTLESMARKMAEDIIPYIQIDSTFDIERMAYRTYGRLRVHVPSTSPQEQLRAAIPEFAKSVDARMEVK